MSYGMMSKDEYVKRILSEQGVITDPETGAVLHMTPHVVHHTVDVAVLANQKIDFFKSNSNLSDPVSNQKENFFSKPEIFLLKGFQLQYIPGDNLTLANVNKLENNAVFNFKAGPRTYIDRLPLYQIPSPKGVVKVDGTPEGGSDATSIAITNIRKDADAGKEYYSVEMFGDPITIRESVKFDAWIDVVAAANFTGVFQISLNMVGCIFKGL